MVFAVDSSRNLKRIEKFFHYVGLVSQMLGAVVILLLAGHYLLGAAEWAHNYVTTGETSKVDARYKSPVYYGDPNRIAYWTEFNKVWGVHFEPYVHWRRNPFSGRFINVGEDSVRRTRKPRLNDGATKVFMFGGSTLWGTGAPDDQTIPSYLQGMLGPDYDVYNYGDTAYVSAQELNLLLLLLSQGKVPGIVIFYDGVNDGYAGAYSPAIPRDPHNLRLRDRVEKPLLVELLNRSNYKSWFQRLATKKAFAAWDKKIAPTIPEHSLGVVDVYEAHIRQVKALAREYGFEAYFFWQPNLFSLTRTHLNAYEEGVIENASPTLVSSQQAVYEAAKKHFSGRQDEHIHFLGNVFDDREEPIYSDWHHVGPHGNEIIAREMFKSLSAAR